MIILEIKCSEYIGDYLIPLSLVIELFKTGCMYGF